MSRRLLSRAAALLAIPLAASLLVGCAGGEAPQGGTAGASTSTETVTETASEQTPEPPALASLMTAEVPALCGHPAGQLVDGVLPGIAEGEGHAGLHPKLRGDIEEGATESALAATGETETGEPFIAAALVCDRGGVSWPATAIAWGADGSVIGTFEPWTLTGGDREAITGVLASDGGIIVRWIATNEYDAACCGQLSAEATVAVTDAGLTAAEPVIHRGETQLRESVEAVLGGGQSSNLVAPEGFFDNLAVALEKGEGADPADVRCADSQYGQSTLVCAVPLNNGYGFLMNTALVGWNDYEIQSFSQELVPAG